MTIQTLGGALYFPEMMSGVGGGRLVSSGQTTGADTNELAMIFTVPTTGTITGVTFNLSAMTAAGGFDVRLETLSAGNPSGTLYGGSSAVTGVTGSGVKTITGLNCTGATAGDIVAVIVKQNGAGGITLTSYINSGQSTNGPAVIQKFTGAWANLSTGPSPNMAVSYGGTYYYLEGVTCWDSSGNNPTAIGGSGNERGIQFVLPFPAQVAGWYINGGPTAVSANFALTLYTDNGASAPTQLVTKAYDGHLLSATSVSYGSCMRAMFDAPVSLSANQAYDLALKQTTANQITINEAILLDAATAAMAGAWSGGTSLKGITRASGVTAFTTSNTRRPYGMGLVLSGFDGGGAGGGGLLIDPGMTGFLNG